jgi:hypothetical protein
MPQVLECQAGARLNTSSWDCIICLLPSWCCCSHPILAYLFWPFPAIGTRQTLSMSPNMCAQWLPKPTPPPWVQCQMSPHYVNHHVSTPLIHALLFHILDKNQAITPCFWQSAQKHLTLSILVPNTVPPVCSTPQQLKVSLLLMPLTHVHPDQPSHCGSVFSQMHENTTPLHAHLTPAPQSP